MDDNISCDDRDAYELEKFSCQDDIILIYNEEAEKLIMMYCSIIIPGHNN